MKDLWGDICWCSATLNHFFIRNQNFGQAKVSYLNLYDFFSSGILLNKDVLGLEVPVHDTTSLHVLDSLNELVHDDSDLSFLQLVGFDVFKQFTSFYLLHDDMQILLSLI
jgi:hypothetical protein